MPVPKHAVHLLKSMSEMTDDELDELVEKIRKRRSVAKDYLEDVKSFARKLSASNMQARLAREVTKTEKLLVQLDKKIEKFEESVLNIRALRMQIE